MSVLEQREFAFAGNEPHGPEKCAEGTSPDEQKVARSVERWMRRLARFVAEDERRWRAFTRRWKLEERRREDARQQARRCREADEAGVKKVHWCPCPYCRAKERATEEGGGT